MRDELVPERREILGWIEQIFAQGIRGLGQRLTHGSVVTPGIQHAHGLRALAWEYKSKSSHDISVL